MLIADFQKSYAQQKTGNVGYSLVSHTVSEIHAARHGNLERHEGLNIEDRVRVRKMPKTIETRRNILRLWPHIAPPRSGCRQSNESSIDSSCTSLAFMIQNGRVLYEKSAESQTLKRARDHVESAHKRNCGSWSAISLTSHIKNACTNKDARRPTWNGIT